MTAESVYRPSPQLVLLFKVLSGLGAAVVAVGFFIAPERTWPGLLVASQYVVGIGLGAAFFLAIGFVSKAGWATAIRRVPEAMTAAIPLGGLLMVATLFGAHSIYHWSHAEAVARDPLLQAKASWLNLPFFSARTVLYVVIWTALAAALVRASRRQDLDGDPRHTQAMVRLSAIFLVAFGVTVSLASFDWTMSVEPHWFSTVFAVYNFAGLFLNALAVMTALVIAMRRRGPFAAIVTEAHLHDLGKLLFAFSTFWAYIWFCQYMLIWYSNIPEETSHYLARQSGAWMSLFLVNLALNWIIPFLALLSQFVKRNEGVLLKVCTLLMAGRALDLYLQVAPASMGPSPQFGVWEAAPLMGALAAFFLVFFKALSKASLVPLKDPYLQESLAHHG